MWKYYLLYLFLAIALKLVFAFAMIYMLFPSDRRCDDCDADTLLVRRSGPTELLSRLTMRRLQWRWCPKCGHEGWARVKPEASRRGHPAPGPWSPRSGTRPPAA